MGHYRAVLQRHLKRHGKLRQIRALKHSDHLAALPLPAGAPFLPRPGGLGAVTLAREVEIAIAARQSALVSHPGKESSR